jgi:hypothetical protein
MRWHSIHASVSLLNETLAEPFSPFVALREWKKNREVIEMKKRQMVIFFIPTILIFIVTPDCIAGRTLPVN